MLWRELWVPAQRLDYAAMLPESLKGTIPFLNTILESLRAEEHSPTSNAGEQAFLLFRQWLTTQYYREHPTASDDLDALGRAMFNEPLESAIMARLFQGDRFGKLE